MFCRMTASPRRMVRLETRKTSLLFNHVKNPSQQTCGHGTYNKGSKQVTHITLARPASLAREQVVQILRSSPMHLKRVNHLALGINHLSTYCALFMPCKICAVAAF